MKKISAKQKCYIKMAIYSVLCVCIFFLCVFGIYLHTHDKPGTIAVSACLLPFTLFFIWASISKQSKKIREMNKKYKDNLPPIEKHANAYT